MEGKIEIIPANFSNFYNLEGSKQLAVLGLAEGKSYSEIAQDLSVTYVTVSRWSKEPEVKAALWELQESVLQETVNRMVALLPRLVTNLAEIAFDEMVPAATRVNASRTIFEELRNTKVFSEVLSRLEQLEREEGIQ